MFRKNYFLCGDWLVCLLSFEKRMSVVRNCIFKFMLSYFSLLFSMIYYVQNIIQKSHKITVIQLADTLARYPQMLSPRVALIHRTIRNKFIALTFLDGMKQS